MQLFSIGKILAHLEAELKVNGSSECRTLTFAEKAYLEDLRNRYRKLTQTCMADQILMKIPDHCCQTTFPYLEDNSDFFLAHILLHKKQKGLKADYALHSEHFNVCYKCFSIYCRVMEEYLKTYNEIVTRTYLRGFTHDENNTSTDLCLSTKQLQARGTGKYRATPAR